MIFIRVKRFLLLLVFAVVLAVTTGCLPEDTVVALSFAPDGKRLAVVSHKQGVRVISTESDDTTEVVGLRIDPASVIWVDDSCLAYAAAPEGSLDVFISALDGGTTRVTSVPSRETYPMRAGDHLLYLTTNYGVAELTTYPLYAAATSESLNLPRLDSDIIHPVLAPNGHSLAFFTFKNLAPHLGVFDLETGRLEWIEDSADPFGLRTDALAWSSDSLALSYMKNDSSGMGKQVAIWRRDNPAEKWMLHSHGDAEIRWPRLLDSGGFVYTSGDHLHGWLDLHLGGQTSRSVSLDFDLPVSLPAVSLQGDLVAFVVAENLVGITTRSLQSARILTHDLEDKFLLAEAYYRSGKSGKSYDLYEELAASVTRTRDPEMARFIYIANLRRLGRARQAVAEIEKLVADEQTTQTVPRAYLWRLLGFSYLLELDDLERAEQSFVRYESLTSDTMGQARDDSALNALQILRGTDDETARLYGRGVKARLEGDFTAMEQLFGDLLTSGSEVPAVHQEYIKALDGFDAEVYYFSPSQRPFQPSRSQRAGYLQRFVDTVSSGSELARSAKLDLFLLRIEMGNYNRARELLLEALSGAPEESRPEGILEVFRNYLETPEPQPWINAAMPEVFLHPEIRPLLMNLIVDPEDRLLMAVAATKMALLEGDPDLARQEANGAGAEWSRIAPEFQTGEMAMLYGRMLVFRAREAELRGLYGEAVDAYLQALGLLEDRNAGNFEFQEEIRYRAYLIRMMLAEYPEMIERLQGLEQMVGAELVNPTWDGNSLQRGVRELAELYGNTSNTIKAWSAYEAGVCLGKLQLNEQSRAAILLAASDVSPHFLQRKAILELASLDEYLNDPWNAARWFTRLAAMPDTSEEGRLWCSYQIARLHLSIGHRVSAAREALALIVSTRPGSPLAVQAQELLISTSIW